VSYLEEHFLDAWNSRVPRSLRLTNKQRQFTFHPTRRWRLDFAWPSVKLAVEINGSSGFARGGHAGTASQRRNELEKLNEAQRLGWRVIQFNDYFLRKCRIHETVDYVLAILTDAQESSVPHLTQNLKPAKLPATLSRVASSCQGKIANGSHKSTTTRHRSHRTPGLVKTTRRKAR
jgi:very-short-patch-repair endonuclease